jgi:hypothetical protein
MWVVSGEVLEGGDGTICVERIARRRRWGRDCGLRRRHKRVLAGTRRSGRGGQRACGRCLETAGDNTFQSLLARRLLLWLVVVCCGLRGVELVVGRAALVVVCNKADAGYPWECPRPLRARDSPPWSSLCTAVARRLASSGVLAARGVQDGGACACVRACPGLLSYPRKHCLESNQIQSDLILAIVA